LGPQSQHQIELVGLGGDYQAVTVPETSQYQCLECGQLLVSPGQLLEHQEMHIKLLGHETEAPPGSKPTTGPSSSLVPGSSGFVAGSGLVPSSTIVPSSGIHYECLECKALFSSQEVWLAHRQSHRSEPGQNQALVDLEHSYRKPEEGEGEGEERDEGSAGTLQLLLYECGECLQLFQSPKDFLEHQATH
ncbi:ZN574 protein, partial [Hemiprocne comata]|nr:ZN574 protein [Hemiprocne comata]